MSTSLVRAAGRTVRLTRDELKAITHSGSAQAAAVGRSPSKLPGKFTARLAAGINPEAIIRDLYEHKREIRNLLELIVSQWPSGVPSKAVAEAEEYLGRHCEVCEKEIPRRDAARTPLCGYCEEQ
ncbi:MAG TPA: hypothetical protein VLM38_16605 [Blastocatellia bacterium]|nr:hypothetical protein [Blastocatellia bacterium]